MAFEIDNLILSYRDYYGTYHHHKEQMAYWATVLYLTGATVIILKGPSIWSATVPKLLIFLTFCAAFIATLSFVAWQLRQREDASDMVKVCTTLLRDRIYQPDAALGTEPDHYKGLDLPRVLAEQLRRVNADRKFFEGPRVSEVLTYLAIVGWSLLALISVLVDPVSIPK